MNKLNDFIEMICGEFENSDQIKKEEQNGKIIHPRAKHMNGVCNGKIINIPNDFEGVFVIEESYYDTNGIKTVLPHLFLFDLNEENKIRLTSYEVPFNIKKEEFTNNNDNLEINFKELKISQKFTPLIYEECNGEFSGKSVSFFSQTTKFTLSEKVTKNRIYVNEVFEKNGKRVMGFDEPIVYDRIRR